MPRRYSSREVLKALTNLGFEKKRKTPGSHQTLVCAEGDETPRTVTVVLDKKQIPVGTFKSILRQAGITQEEFEDALNG